MAFTPRALITRALKDIGAFGHAETPGSSDLTDGLARLNALRDQWNADVQIPPVLSRTAYVLTANDGEYTVGPTDLIVSDPREEVSADMWQTLDFAALDTTNLDANDHFGTTGRWTIVDPASKFTMAAAAEVLFPAVINDTLLDTSGTHGLQYDASVAGFANRASITFALTAYEPILSAAFALRFSGLTGSFGEHDVARLETSLGVRQLYVKLGDSNGATLYLFNEVDGYSSGGGISLSEDEWYWVTVKYDSTNAASGMKLEVYNTAGAQVGTTQELPTDVASAGEGAAIKVGSFIGGTDNADIDATIQWDDIIVNYDGDFPLGTRVGSNVSAVVANFTGPRPTPANLMAAKVIAVGSTREVGLDILTRQRYTAEGAKTATAAIPRQLYLEPTAPVSTIQLMPIPTTACTLVLYVKSLLTEFALDTSYDMKEGYELAFQLELSRLSCRGYGKPMPEGLAADALQAVAIVKRTNEDVAELGCDSALTGAGGYDIGIDDDD